MPVHRLRLAALPAACAVVTLAVLAPVLRPGFVLVYDMVFAPHRALTRATVGIGPALPRAVPADAVVAALAALVPGDLVQKVVLVAALFGAGLGAGRLVPTQSVPGRIVAATGYTWNAYVAERLFIGHWGLLLGYASLPWVVSAALALRRAERAAAAQRDDRSSRRPRSQAEDIARLVVAFVPAVLTPTGGLLGAGAALAAAGRRRAAVAGGIALVLNAPWWVPSLLHPGSAVSDPAGVAAFAARGEGRLGPVPTVLGLGGLWNAAAVPASRNSPLVAVSVVVLCAAAVFGLRVLARRWDPAAVRSLTVLAALGLLLACAGALPGTGAALRWAVGQVPGAGLLRDGQKWVAWWALPLALGVALAVERLAARVGSASARAAALAGAALLPLAIMPDLAWGGFGRLEPVGYPPDWGAVSRLVADRPRTGDVLLLPLSTYRRFAWNGDRTQLDPAPVALPRAVIGDDTLVVGGVAVHGEDPRVDQVRRAVAARQPLGPLGVGWVLVEHGTPGTTDPAMLAELTPVYDGRWLTLYRVPGPVATAAAPAPPAPPVIAADVLALELVTVAWLRLVVPVNIVRSPQWLRWRRLEG